MEIGQRYRLTWKHPKGRRRKMAEGVYLGVKGDHYAIERRDGTVIRVDRTHSVNWISLVPSL